MNKILAVIGSPNNEKSNTAAMVKDFLETVKENAPDTEYEIISLGGQKIEPCRGCWACMKTGCCAHKNDALPNVMRKMKECDLLIIGTPVYEQQMSAQTKALFDRTFMWIHLVGLMGKPAITAVTAGADGIWMTEKYLSGIMTMMGCIMTGRLRGIGKQPGCFPDREKCKIKYRPLARRTAELLCGKRKLRPGIMNRLCFMFMKSHTKRLCKNSAEGSGYTEYELRHWLEKGWFDMSFKKAMKNAI